MIDLDSGYALDPSAVRRFREDGFIKLKNVLGAETIATFEPEITRLTLAKAPAVPLEERGTYGKAFIQVGNLWTQSDVVKRLSLSKRLGRLAAELMGTEGVRMYHDQALYKEAGGGFTPWHVDQQYWPVDSGNTVTAWIPLQATPIEMGPLQFGKGSHLKNIGRDLEIGDESEQRIREAVKEHGLIEVYEPYDLGEVSFHYGWTLHRAGPNTTGTPRKVHTIIYIDRDIRITEPKNANQELDRKVWFEGMPAGEVASSRLNPIIWEK